MLIVTFNILDNILDDTTGIMVFSVVCVVSHTVWTDSSIFQCLFVIA